MGIAPTEIDPAPHTNLWNSMVNNQFFFGNINAGTKRFHILLQPNDPETAMQTKCPLTHKLLNAIPICFACSNFPRNRFWAIWINCLPVLKHFQLLTHRPFSISKWNHDSVSLATMSTTRTRFFGPTKASFAWTRSILWRYCKTNARIHNHRAPPRCTNPQRKFRLWNSCATFFRFLVGHNVHSPTPIPCHEQFDFPTECATKPTTST